MRFRQVTLTPTMDNTRYKACFIVWSDKKFGTTIKGGAWTFVSNNEKNNFILELIT